MNNKRMIYIKYLMFSIFYKLLINLQFLYVIRYFVIFFYKYIYYYINYNDYNDHNRISNFLPFFYFNIYNIFIYVL